MSDHPTAGPSLILTQHEKAHREHLRSHQHQHQNQHHNHLHLRQEQAAATSVVTEVTQTISVVQQINVDSNGSTFGVETHLAESTSASSPALTDVSAAAAASSTIAASPIVTSDALQPTSTEPGASASGASQSLSTNLGSSLPSSTLSTDSSFASLSVISNSSSTFIPSSSSFSSNLLSNSTTSTSSSSISTSLTFLTSSSTSSFSELSTSSQRSTTLTSAFSTTSPRPTSTGDGSSSSSSSLLGVGSGSDSASSTSVESSSAPTSTSDSDGGNGTSGTATPTPVVVGSVVGSIAGFAVILLVLLVILRWWKKKKGGHLSLSSTNPSSGTRGVDFGNTPIEPSGGTGGMQERRSIVNVIPAALGNLTGLNKRDRTSRQTDRTVSSTAGSERGFYRVSGRKLPSVLQHGGDGYGEPGQRGDTMSGQSFYRDSQGFYGGEGGSAGRGSVLPTLINPNRDSAGGIPIMRPSPARTPVTAQGPFIFPSPPKTPPQPADMVGPEVAGRSNVSQDGSHASRFTEEV